MLKHYNKNRRKRRCRGVCRLVISTSLTSAKEKKKNVRHVSNDWPFSGREDISVCRTQNRMSLSLHILVTLRS